MNYIPRADAAIIALSMYEGEKCRICGKMVDHNHMLDAVFAGYSKTHQTRIAHKSCWDSNRDRLTWVIPE